MAVLLLVLQTSQNEVVYSAWTNKLSDRFMSNVVVSGMKLSHWWVCPEFGGKGRTLHV
jgi:hypothetical protein